MPSPAALLAAALIFTLLLALLCRAVTALLFTAYLLGVVLVCSVVKQAYLGMPLTLSDQLFFFMAPIQNFKLFLNYPVLGLALAAVLASGLAVIVAGMRFEPPIRRLSDCGWARLSRALIGAAVVGFAVLILMPRAGAQKLGDGDAYAAYLVLQSMQKPTNLIERLNIFFDNREVLATLPTYRQQHRFPLPDPVSVQHAGLEWSAAAGAAALLRPDILMVLEESTFDPALIARCHYAPCRSAMFQSAATVVRTEQSPLIVHSTGGGTWLSEFAFLSGFDWRAFGRGGAFAPVSLAPRLNMALPRYLRSLGYRTIAVYPVDGNFLSARAAYRAYGFDEFHAAEDLHLPGDWHEVRDAMVFDKALEFVQQSDDARPIFIFVLTIRNHGPHGVDGKVPSAAFAEVDRKLGHGLGDYLERLADSRQDFADLRQRWLRSDRARIIGWFGDHQPEIAWDYIDTIKDLNLDRLAANVGSAQLKYLTYYQLNANFGRQQADTGRDGLDLAFLGAHLLQFAGLPIDASYKAALQTSVACHGQLFSCADRALVQDYFAYRIYDLQAIQ